MNYAFITHTKVIQILSGCLKIKKKHYLAINLEAAKQVCCQNLHILLLGFLNFQHSVERLRFGTAGMAVACLRVAINVIQTHPLSFIGSTRAPLTQGLWVFVKRCQ